MPTKLSIAKLRLNGGTQPRDELDGPTVMEYADAMDRGVEFPPVKAMYDGTDYWLYDGFHRVKAAQNIDRTTIRVDVQQGTKQDAQWESLAANKDHGLRRTQSDKRRAIKRALKMKGADKPNRSIARHVGCDHKTVAKYRREMEPSGEIPQIKKRTVTRNGTTYTQDTSNIGKSRSNGSKPTPTPTKPSAPQISSNASAQKRRARRKQQQESEPQWDTSFQEDKTPTKQPKTQKQVAEKYADAAAGLSLGRDVQQLRDFVDRQHQFSTEERAEVKQAAENSIAELRRIVESIN